MTILKMRAINHGTRKADKNRYCGPAVISSLTGITTAGASRLIRHINPRRTRVIGTYSWEVCKALRLCGVIVNRIDHPTRHKITLARWLKLNIKERTPGRIFLIDAGYHWQLVSGRKYVCGRIGDIVSIKHPKVKRRARVRQVYEITAHGTLTIPTDITDSPAVSDHTKDQNRWRYKAKKLAKEWNLDIENDWYGWGNEKTVFGNSETEEHKDYPYYDDHTSVTSNDWKDIYECCKDIINFMKEHNIKP
jgi:hypothetical protein